MRLISEEPARVAGVDAQRRHPAQVGSELDGPTRQRRDRSGAGQDDVVVHERQQRPGEVFEKLESTAREGTLSIAIQLVLAADMAILRQPQDGRDIPALDGWLLPGVDDEDLQRLLFLQDEVGDDGRQHGTAFGQDADLNRGRGVDRHQLKSSSRRGRTARKACSDSGLIFTLSRM